MVSCTSKVSRQQCVWVEVSHLAILVRAIALLLVILRRLLSTICGPQIHWLNAVILVARTPRLSAVEAWWPYERVIRFLRSGDFLFYFPFPFDYISDTSYSQISQHLILLQKNSRRHLVRTFWHFICFHRTHNQPINIFYL